METKELTIEELKALVEDQKTQLAVAKSENDQLKATIEDQNKQLEAAKSEKEQLQVLVEDKSKELEAAKSEKETLIAEDQPTTIEVDGKQYRFALKSFVISNHGKMTSEEAATDTDVIADILAIEGQSILVEVQ